MNMAEEKNDQLISDYFLLNYMVYREKEFELLEKAKAEGQTKLWDQWHCMILIETEQHFFDLHDESFFAELRTILHSNFYYLNLTACQSLLFFGTMNCDYLMIAKKIIDFLKQRFPIRFYLAISNEFNGYSNLPFALEGLNNLLDKKYHHPEQRVFIEEDEEFLRKETESQDSELLQKISEDVWRRDAESLWNHYHILEEKYRDSRKYSAMYVKYIFSGVVEELCQEKQFEEEHGLVNEINKIYCCNNMSEIQKIAKENVKCYEEYLTKQYIKDRKKILSVKQYIEKHCAKKLDFEELARIAGLSVEYLPYVFKKETGTNLVEYIQYVRLMKGMNLLCSTNLSIKKIAAATGIATEKYFRQCFERHFGNSPEKHREIYGINNKKEVDKQ